MDDIESSGVHDIFGVVKRWLKGSSKEVDLEVPEPSVEPKFEPVAPQAIEPIRIAPLRERVPSAEIRRLLEYDPDPGETLPIKQTLSSGHRLDYFAAAPDRDSIDYENAISAYDRKMIREYEEYPRNDRGLRTDGHLLFRGEDVEKTPFRDGFQMKHTYDGDNRICTTRDPRVAFTYSRHIYAINAPGGFGSASFDQVNFFGGIDAKYILGRLDMPEWVWQRYTQIPWYAQSWSDGTTRSILPLDYIRWTPRQ
jgi:hypothetical protein